LPFEAQQSVVFALCAEDVNNDGLTDILLGGNLYETHPSFGRLDASYGLLMINQGKMEFKSLPADQSGVFIEGAVRSIKSLSSNGKQRYLFVRNNNTPLLLEK